MQWNIRSIQKNRIDLINLIHKHRPDLFFINETWLKQERGFFLKTFHIIRQDREVLIKDYVLFDFIKKYNNGYIKIKNVYLTNIYSSNNN